MRNLLKDKRYIEETFDTEKLQLKKPITCPENIFSFTTNEPMKVCRVCKVEGCDLYWLNKYIEECINGW